MTAAGKHRYFIRVCNRSVFIGSGKARRGWIGYDKDSIFSETVKLAEIQYYTGLQRPRVTNRLNFKPT
jgi:hypothetical protein